MRVDENGRQPDSRITRRNLLAGAGLLTSVIVAGVAGGSRGAHAHGRRKSSRRKSWGWGWGGRHHNRESGGGSSCFLSGTTILTEFGEIEIENIKVGDKVRTLSGELLPVKRVLNWNAVRSGDEDWEDDVAPIKICHSALAPNVPRRDLYLSPAHAIYTDGVLIRARGLVNGRSIVRCRKYEATCLSYFHIELDEHQVIVAEGAYVETLCAAGMTMFAPAWLCGPKTELLSRLRSAASPWIDMRNAADKARDGLEVRSSKWSRAAESGSLIL